MTKSDVRILEAQPYFSVERARVPLKFGGVVVEGVTFAHARVRVENSAGQVADGWGAIPLSDFWGWPSKVVAHDQRDAAMRLLVQECCTLAARHGRFAHPVGIFQDLESELASSAAKISAKLALPEQIPYLAALICLSIIDAAVHDAFGIANGISTYDGYGSDFMPDLAQYLGPSFRGKYLNQFIQPTYKPWLPLFHLVGGLDKLRSSEVSESDPQDGLPNSLDEWIAHDGLRCLKVKLGGKDLAWDLQRLLEVEAVAREAQAKLGIDELYLSADTNEQCESPDYIVELLSKLREVRPSAYQALLYVEQPTERDLNAHRFDMSPIAALKPVIIDESLITLEDFELAMQLNWSGIALKTCKCHTHALLFAAKAAQAGVPYTVQDLTNTGISLVHSVGLAARLNTLMGVEANSRQFFPASNAPEAAIHPHTFQPVNGQVSTLTFGPTGLGYRINEIARDIFINR
ncbi:MAG: enolase C-terminal domain-like protein [Anaerolineae bacterium]